MVLRRSAEKELEDETKAEWYLRQLLAADNFDGGRFLHVMSGSLGYQIEHHLFPDLPSNRFPEIAVRVRELCEQYRLPYTTGPLYRQYSQTLRTIMRLALPNRARNPRTGRIRRSTPEEQRAHRGVVAPQARGRLSRERPNVGLGDGLTARRRRPSVPLDGRRPSAMMAFRNGLAKEQG